mmetsp:Transcript_60765/g.130553  ORF Transcript_60765/g.130553 Transcript_60765/m.130553 type:complete len:194 (+) Transcript_60765:138-719(+)|eukprot:CAMPEP_0180420130 /NCGR_PEP_ID=MMETSP1036_2-20121128/2472_1 /TAXON_ID=632150 /ORGANISM="Azadinium spinosum, Strain 3D9" /LENGTH=193 /DNA_ID=CAMNT_0022425345 /DNA_START=140 /DNA_END=721 /DNA_ORIENTATION=-
MDDVDGSGLAARLRLDTNMFISEPPRQWPSPQEEKTSYMSAQDVPSESPKRLHAEHFCSMPATGQQQRTHCILSYRGNCISAVLPEGEDVDPFMPRSRHKLKAEGLAALHEASERIRLRSEATNARTAARTRSAELSRQDPEGLRHVLWASEERPCCVGEKDGHLLGASDRMHSIVVSDVELLEGELEDDGFS